MLTRRVLAHSSHTWCSDIECSHMVLKHKVLTHTDQKRVRNRSETGQKQLRNGSETGQKQVRIRSEPTYLSKPTNNTNSGGDVVKCDVRDCLEFISLHCILFLHCLGSLAGIIYAMNIVSSFIDIKCLLPRILKTTHHEGCVASKRPVSDPLHSSLSSCFGLSLSFFPSFFPPSLA